MNVHFISQYSRREEIRGYAKKIKSVGHISVSRWITEPNGIDKALNTKQGIRIDWDSVLRTIETDMWNDMLSSDICIFFIGKEIAVTNLHNGCVQLGAAKALNKRCILIGSKALNSLLMDSYFEYFETFDNFICSEKK